MEWRGALATAALGVGTAAVLVVLPAWTGSSGTARAVEFKPLADFQALRYTPKMTPDTVLDYRPRITHQYKHLPPRSVGALPQLLHAFEQIKSATAKLRGRWVAGMTNLGANIREYRPSDAELLLAVVGNRIRSVVRRGSLGQIASTLDQTGTKLERITYNAFEFRHADVIGEGRYFYCSGPRRVTVLLRSRLDASRAK
jgi:hypothetical protein